MVVKVGSVSSTESCASFSSIALVAKFTGTWSRPFLFCILLCYKVQSCLFLKKVYDDGDLGLDFLIIILQIKE